MRRTLLRLPAGGGEAVVTVVPGARPGTGGLRRGDPTDRVDAGVRTVMDGLTDGAGTDEELRQARMDQLTIDWGRYRRIRDAEPQIHSGKVQQVVGLTVEASGPQARLGDRYHIFSTDGGNTVEARWSASRTTSSLSCRWAR